MYTCIPQGRHRPTLFGYLHVLKSEGNLYIPSYYSRNGEAQLLTGVQTGFPQGKSVGLSGYLRVLKSEDCLYLIPLYSRKAGGHVLFLRVYDAVSWGSLILGSQGGADSPQKYATWLTFAKCAILFPVLLNNPSGQI